MKEEPSRSIGEVGPGDFIKLKDGQWHEIASNSYPKDGTHSKNWNVTTKDGRSATMWDALRYAKKEDLE